MKMLDARCVLCSRERLDFLVRDDGVIQPCESCGGSMERLHLPTNRPTVLQDSIEGGVLIKHGICNPDGTPKRYYSRSEIRKAADAAGLTNLVEHVTDPRSGSDKNKHTSRWI